MLQTFCDCSCLAATLGKKKKDMSLRNALHMRISCIIFRNSCIYMDDCADGVYYIIAIPLYSFLIF